MRRFVTLVNQVALATTDSAGLQAQMVGANQAATRARVVLEAMRRQAKGLTQEYDRLLTEHTQLQTAEAGWVVGDPEWACDMGLELGQLWPKQSMKELMGSLRVDSSSPCQDATTPFIWKTSFQPVSAGRIPPILQH
ncbi:unnamed protein product [Arctogadus glacialis]